MNYHRNQIKNFAKIGEQLYKLSNDKMFLWTKEHESAFKELKGAAIKSPILYHPTPDGTFILVVDACGKQIGGALSTYVLLPSQRTYCTTRKELLFGEV